MKTTYACVMLSFSLLLSGCQPEKPANEADTAATFFGLIIRARTQFLQNL